MAIINTIKSGLVPDKRKPLIAIIGGLLFLALTLLAVSFDIFVIWAIPPVLLILLLAVISIDRFFMLLIFLVPLSVQLRFFMDQPPADLFIPTEFMTFIIMIIILYKILAAREYDNSFFRNPVSILIIIMLLWMFISAIAGSSFIVSLKYLIAQTWFVSAFYFLALELFRKPGMIKKSLVIFIIGMIPVVLYNIYNLSLTGLFNQRSAHSSMRPFFNDHTSFGASLAFLIPVVIWLIYSSSSRINKLLYTIVLIVFFTGIVFSYSRAAWISLIIALLFGLLMLSKISWKISIPSFGLILIMLLFMWPSIVRELNDISQTSSGNLAEHLKSVANITTDDSNMERINRWKSALRMTSERPLFGWGPGTYQFKYAPYQFSYDKTSISTNFGTGGNAHSEYLGSLVESGIPGALIFILVVLTAFFTGLKAWDRLAGSKTRFLALALLCGLVSYFIHGALNNFLDTDKIASLFWMYIAALVILSKAKDPIKLN